MSLENIHNFFHFLQKFREIDRIIYVNKEKDLENDAEHSFQLAMMGWYVASTEKLDMDMDKIIRYALVHDLVEVYAGDSLPFTRTEQDQKNKETDEKDAIETIRQNFSEFPELADWIETYEKKEDPESLFVYALDKMIATLNNYHQEGVPLWKDYNITFDQIVNYSLEKAKKDPTIGRIYAELIADMKAREGDLFG